MQFNSFEYWIFFAVVCCILALCKAGATRIVIIVASYIFYSFWDPRFTLLLLGSTLGNYVFGIAIDNSTNAMRRKMLVILAIIFNLTILGFFKYFNFFAESFIGIFHLEAHSLVLNVLLPVGVSFFTFEGIAYCVDVFRKDLPAVRDVTDFALFISFFPHLVAGPIIRPENFFPQVQRRIRLTTNDLTWGACQIVKGLVKKVIFADFFALVANNYFGDPAHSAVSPAIGVLAFAMQIYFDFAGYTDVARGCAALLGFRFPSNFERPYLATDIADFWRRWHISLSTWLRDYLYIPLGGNRVHPGRAYLNLMIVMGLGGLWHGASWNYMVWGLAHGVMLCAHRLWSRHLKGYLRLPSTRSLLTSSVSTAITFISVAIAWVPFRATDFSITAVILKQIFSVHSFSLSGATPEYWMLLAVSVIWCFVDRHRRVQHWFTEKMPYSLAGIPIGLALVCLELFGQFDQQIPFIYFKF